MHRNKVMRKLLGQPSNTISESIDPPIADSPQLRPSNSQNTIYRAGAPITCLDRSADGKRAVIAGPNVFKILKVDGSTITEDFDVRSALASYASTYDPTAATADQLNIGIVKWSHGILDTTLITAGGNGRVTVYDLNRAGSDGFEVGRIVEHSRQVHQLAINPFKPNWLLSASQDGTIKSFDIRTPTLTKTGQSRFLAGRTFKANADAVRDVQWSPSDGMEFASSTDAGVVLKWDARKPNAPVLKLSAHSGSCFTISWHPDGEHLISGGQDQQCRVWDLSKKAERNQKPRYSFLTQGPISNVTWRPAYWSATAQGRRAAHVAVAYDDSNPSITQTAGVHLWDLARPLMPYKEIEQWDKSPKGILWHTRDLLWSIDDAGTFTQTDVAFVPRAVDRRTVSTFELSSTGQALVVFEERHPHARRRPSVNSRETSPSVQRESPAPLFSVSRSDSEDEAIGSFLSAHRPRRHRRRQSERSTHLSTTPPIATAMAESKVLSLNESIAVTGIYEPQQVVAYGPILNGTVPKSTYHYYGNAYFNALWAYQRAAEEDKDGLLPDARLGVIMDTFAQVAWAVGHDRLASTWRVLAKPLQFVLPRRAEYHRKQRLAIPEIINSKSSQDKAAKRNSGSGMDTPKKYTYGGKDTPKSQKRSPSPGTVQRAAKSPFSEEPESTSNVATPLVRPIRDTIVLQTREAMQTSLTIDNDPLNLPEAAHSTSPSPIPVPGASSRVTSNASIEGYDFYGMDTFSTAIPYTAPQKKQPLRLDYSETTAPQRIQPLRHDSSESFQMFSTSGDSHSTRFMSSSSSDGQNSFEKDSSRDLRERAANWDSSFGSTVASQNDQGDDTDTEGSTSPASTRNRTRANTSTVPPPLPILRVQEASAPTAQGPPVPKASTTEATESLPVTPTYSKDPNIIASDYLHWPNDPDFTADPLELHNIVPKAIQFEVLRTAMHASAMILLLQPFLPDDSLDKHQTPAILKQYNRRLMDQKLFTEAALFRKCCAPLGYSHLFAHMQQDVSNGFICNSCNKPYEPDPAIPGSTWQCPHCRIQLDDCSICNQRELSADISYPEEDAGVTRVGTWWYCPGCGHGGHTYCMEYWHAPSHDGAAEGTKHSGGGCPVCLHPCLPGRCRDEWNAEKAKIQARELEKLVRENSRITGARERGSGVRRDAREVNQSRAVEGVRAALNLGNVPGVERKKSVKLVAPGEEEDAKKK